jgi:hypothetical protein
VIPWWVGLLMLFAGAVIGLATVVLLMATSRDPGKG